MDQDVINLAKAIRQKESGGNFDAVGDNGTSKGAYQWQAATWKGHAKQILGDENAQMTRDNQQAVAYGVMKTWKDSGLNPAQIAAKWNSGSEKGWENKIGTTTINGKPIEYNVPQYVKDVTDTYQKFKLETQPTVAQQTAPYNAPGNIYNPGVTDVLPQEKPGFLSTLGSAIKENVIDPFTSRFSNIDYANQGTASDLLQSAGAIAGGTVEALGKTAMGTYNAVGDIPTIGQVIAPKTSETVTSALDATGKAISSAIPDSTKTALSDWATQHPEAAANLGAIVDIASIVPIGKGFQLGKEAIGEIGVKKLLPFGIKTADEILNTPVENLYKLSQTERSFYFSKKAEEASKKFEQEIKTATVNRDTGLSDLNKSFQETTSKISAAQVATIDAVKANAEKLNKQLADASIAEVEALKPKLSEAMRRSSNTYRQLVDEEISKVADVQVTNNEIASFIRNKYEFDQPKAEQIISLLKSKTDGPQTVKSVYENTKNLRKDIGKSAQQGGRTLTAEEYNTTEAISNLVDFLKVEKGVDLAKANKFWSEYAPIKNKLFKYIQPYKPAGTETASFKTFAKILTSNDPYNKNFISETEKLLGVSFKDSKAREILSKIDDNKKQQILAKIDAKTKLDKAKLDKLDSQIKLKEKLLEGKEDVKARKALDEQKQELLKLTTTLKAERRNLFKKIIGGILVLGIGQQATQAVLGGF